MTTCIATHLSPARRAGDLTLARVRRPARRAVGRAIAAVCVLVGCGDASPRAGKPATATADPTSSRSATATTPRPVPGSSVRRADPWWSTALSSDDPAAVAALAAHVGPVALADALGDEDAVRAVALRGLPHADRADLALGALADALAAGRGDEEAVADAIEGVLVSARRDVEVVDPDGTLRCAAALDAVAAAGGRGDLGRERARELARRLRARAP